MKTTLLSITCLALISGLANAEVCVENDAGLSERQLAVAFTASKDANQKKPIDWHRLPNGEEYCQGSAAGKPLYLAIFIRPMISDPDAYKATKTFYYSMKPFSAVQTADIGFAVELKVNRTPKVTAHNGGHPKTVPMHEIHAKLQP
jgi:hypothetical protein